jgi:hypothetical protein
MAFLLGSGLTEKRSAMTNQTSAAKARHPAAVIAARLKPCPSQSLATPAAGVHGSFATPGMIEENEMNDNGVPLDRDPDYIEYVERCYWQRELALSCVGLAVFVFLFCAASAWATTYYVSSSAGNDANSGMSSSAAWQTIAHVNGQTFQPGDSILFKRGDVWNESLTPPSSGTLGNPITFDAYGTGAAPNLTGYYSVPTTAWVLVSGNAWKAPLSSGYTTVNFCLFGSIWGQKVSAVSSNLTAQWDFYFANGYVYVYSVGSPALYYNEPIVPMALSNVPVININGQSWLTFQHFLVNWFDQYGVFVQGASDHLIFANMEADSLIPQGTQPLGFYVDESAPGPGDIRIYNAEAHLNYDGFRFDGAATAITMVNDKGYGNRDGALVDNTGAVTYSYCHFYASSLAVAGSTDVEWTSGTGPTAGAGNVPVDTAPAVQVYQRYPAIVTLTVDDEGMTPGADTYYANTVLPVADAAGVPVGAAITVGYPLAQTLVSEFQGWINAGRDVTSHSISHTYYVNADALDIQYVGSGTAATLNISSNTLTITVTGAPGDSVSYNLARGQPQGTMLELAEALAATGKYTYSFQTPCQGPYGTGCAAYTAEALLSQDLADVSGQDVKPSVYHMQLNVTSLTTDEITLSRQWMTTNLTGLPATPVYVYPGGYETTTMQGITEGVPYNGARGALKEDLGVKDTYADGFNAQNVTSFGVNPSWMGIAPAALNQHIQALVWKESVWGVPWGIFWHLNELTNDDPVGGTEITNLIQDFKANGATIETNTGLVNWLLSGTQETGTDGNYYYKFPATSMTLDFRPTKNSPVVDAGQNLGAAYELDINGVNQNSYGSGWEIGAHVFQGYAVYGEGSGTGSFEIGGVASATGLPALPQIWVDNNEAADGLAYTPPAYELALGASTGSWITGPPSTCSGVSFTLTNYVTTGAGLQAAITALEACRTASGGTAGFYLDVPPGSYSTVGGIVVPQTALAQTATSFIVIRSTQDSALAALPEPVCAGGIQDNLPSSPNPGLINSDCTGQNMYYSLGPRNVSGVLTGITTLSANTTTIAAITATGLQLVPLANGYVSPGNSYVIDTGGNQETVVGVSGVSQSGLYANFTKTHSSGVAVTYNIGAFSLANGTATNTANYNYAQYMYSVTCTAANCVPFLLCNPTLTGAKQCSGSLGPDHWMIEDGNFYPPVGSTGENPVFNMLETGLETASTQFATHIHIRRSWAHGDWTSLTAGANAITAGFAMGTVVYGSVVGSQTSQILSPGSECHAIGANGTTYKFDNNWLEGCTSGIFAGGYSSMAGPSIFGWVPFQDVEMRRNRLTFPYAWLGQMTIPSGNTHWAGNSLVRKNCNEWKEWERVVRDGNICENVDNSGGQNGTILTINIRNTSAGLHGQNYQSTGLDVTISNEIDRNACQGYEIGARSSSTVGDGGGVSYPIRRFSLANDLEYNITNTNPGCAGTGAFGIQMSSSTQSWQGTITENSAGTAATFVATCSVDGGDCPSGPPSLGFQVMDISAGDPASITGCTAVTAFNVPTHTISGHVLPVGVGPLASAGSAVWTGTYSSAGVTVTYPWVATANAVDNSGNCTLTNEEGGPFNVSLTHHLLDTDAVQAIGNGNSLTNGPNFQVNHLLRDSIILSSTASAAGWYNSVVGEGNPTEIFNYDYTSMSAYKLVWPGRTASKYNEYGNNPLFADPAGCTGTGCNPPTTIYFPATSYCTGATPTSSCVGFSGAMSASSMPLTLGDYHGYELMSGSVFKAGGSQQASDGTDMGPNIPAIDAAETNNVYVCATACGSPGPYPDSNGIPAQFFGLNPDPNIAGGSEPWTEVNFGAVRLWDTETYWGKLNTASGVYDWTELDAWTSLAAANGNPDLLYTFGQLPTWASSNPTDSSCTSAPGSCDPPSDLNADGTGADLIWQTFVTAIVNHTASKIKFWEIWNEPNVPAEWTGTYAQMVRMAKDAYSIIHSLQPGALVTTPTPVNDGISYTISGWFPGYLAAGGAAYADIATFHGYPATSTTDSANTVVEDINAARSGTALAFSPLWDTEVASTLTDPDMQAAFVGQLYLLQWSLGVSRVYWFQYGDGGPSTLWDENGQNGCNDGGNGRGCMEEAGVSYSTVYNWMVGNTMTTACSVAGTVWTCGLSGPNGYQAEAIWDTSQTCGSGICSTGNQTVPAIYTQYSDLAGDPPVSISGHVVPVGLKPILLEN